MSTAPIRVVMLIDRYWPHVGGSEIVAKMICETLHGRGFQFSIVTRNYDGTLPVEERVDGVLIRRFGKSRQRQVSKLQFLVGVVDYLLRHRNEYEMVHIHLQQYDLDSIAAWAVRRLARKPYVLHVHGSYVLPWMLNLAHHPELRVLGKKWLPASFYADILRRAGRLIAVDCQTQDLASRQGLRHCRHIPNPVRFRRNGTIPPSREALRRQLGLPQEAFVAVAVGMLRPEKNHVTLLRAWQRFAESAAARPVQLMLLGDAQSSAPKTARTVREYAAAHCLDSVVFAGLVPNVEDYLRAADVFVLPSLMEGLSLAIAEAMDCGLPVVVSDIPGNRDLVPSEEYGLLCPPMDHEGFAAHLGRLFNDAALGRMLGERAQRRAREHFGLEAAMDRVADLYHDVLGRRNTVGVV